ncbi:MAG TPA: c-type cytochrome domain-containing protein [Sunxiuqinia sp.]|nr:c-type cytochrome domain-containing protein [Sunxiuqinia sp.]
MKRLLILSSIFLAFISVSCQHDAPSPDQFDQVCFQEKILPIFQTGCAISGCHSGGNNEAGYDFSNYNGIMQAISPGAPEKSKAYKAIIEKWGEGAMPPSNPLPESQRTLIRLWIEQGALNTNCSSNGAITDTTTSTASTGTGNLKDTTICFQNEVLPILLSSCATSGCHDAASSREGVVLDSYAHLMNRNMVDAGNANNSTLYNITNPTRHERMPPKPNAALTDSQRLTIKRWINEGAQNTDCTNQCDTSAYTFAAVIAPIIENNCRGCHTGSSAHLGIVLDNYSDVKTIADNGLLSDVINGLNGKPQMPPSSPLSSCEIAQIENWINNGSQND